MKITALLLGLLTVSTAWAAESPLLKDIMGTSVYEESGITDLTEEQMKVLETWILENAVERRVVTQQAQPPKTHAKKHESNKDSMESPATPPASPSARQSATSPAAAKSEPAVVIESQPRYVRLAESPEEETEAEEPATQKYVRIETLDERDRHVEPDLIRSRIDGPFKGWRNNRTRFQLENGEIWEQRQSGTYITSLDSPEIIIRKNRFGYTMEVPAVGRKVHVKRIR